MHIFDNFEKKFLFGLTRIFAMVIILGILIAIGIGGMLFGGIFGGVDTKVSAIEVVDFIKPPTIANVLSADINSTPQKAENVNGLPSVKMPFVLQKHFNTPEIIQTLKGWLDVLPMDIRQEFIDEMSATVTESEKLKLPPYEAIDKYKELKFKKLEVEQSAKAERRTRQLYFAAAVVGAAALIALFSLILVLLAIERNTRRAEK